MKRCVLVIGVASTLGASTLGGCVVRERTVDRPRGCPGGMWVERYRGPHGRWYRGHWRCPGVVERIEIE